ncbi:MAG: M20/M25/M40 family metallo-hydrolase, partial [Rikenellaceae bacterium]
HSSRLINLDSEDDGEVYVGCAGGKDTVGHFALEYRPSPRGIIAINICVDSLRGGHSGDDINKQRANAVVLLCRFLFENFNNFNMNLVHIDAGGLRNAIAREATATITIQKSTLPYFEKYFTKFVADVRNEYSTTEPSMNIRYDIADNLPDRIVERSLFLAVITSVYTLPCGVVAFSQTLPGFVETSTNVASVKIKDEMINVTTSQRSSLNSKREYIANVVAEILEGCGAEVEQSKGYPGWSPNSNSDLLKRFQSSYKALFKNDIKVKTVHAGLECGLFLEKASNLDMVSVGPTILNVHSPSEMLEISTVEKFWTLITDVLKNMK